MSILLAGFSGLAGSAIYERLTKIFGSVVGVNTKVLDLTNRKLTFEYINDLKPEIVIDAAARSGGIKYNDSRPVEFISKNLQIQTNLMDASHSANVRKFIFLGSSCIYPKHCPQPIREEYLMTGNLEDTNRAYAIAKISGLELIRAYRKQFGRKWISLMPTNLYGPHDNFNVETGHVLPALINRFVLAAQNGQRTVTLWGSGMAKREFLHSGDLAAAVELSIEKYDSDLHLNVGSGNELTIKELAEMIARLSGFSGDILWDSRKPDGTPRKILDSSRLKALGWHAQIDLEAGIRDTITWFNSMHRDEN
jgi:GDP-L-fucose synthase